MGSPERIHPYATIHSWRNGSFIGLGIADVEKFRDNASENNKSSASTKDSLPQNLAGRRMLSQVSPILCVVGIPNGSRQ